MCSSDLTVVTRLLGVVAPHVAIFGAKDYQQVAVVRRLVADLGLDVEILVEPTVRDVDGLALSSRNARLSTEGRKSAAAVPRALNIVEEAFESGLRDAGELERRLRLALDPLQVDYAVVVDDCTLGRPEPGSRLVALVAVRVDGVRLIDNHVLGARITLPS